MSAACPLTAPERCCTAAVIGGISGPPPLRETLAAGILMLLGWRGERPLLDPMCGSGTFLVEGAMLALGQPPGAGREFAFMGWPRYRPGLWNALLLDSDRRVRGDCPPLLGADRDGPVLEAARCNARRAGVLDHLSLQTLELDRQASIVAPTGLAVCNPLTELGSAAENCTIPIAPLAIFIGACRPGGSGPSCARTNNWQRLPDYP
ncbi:MAG: hypothetical protein R2864_04330 [Syntrophotaleaceae bacterium]